MTRDLEACFVTKRARRCAIALAEHTAEMSGIVETPAKADVGDRDFFVQRIDELSAAPFEPARTQVDRETLSDRFKQLLQIARRDPFLFRQRGDAQFRISELRFDRAAHARKD